MEYLKETAAIVDVGYAVRERLKLKEKIEYFMHYFTTITKDESDFIESVLKWDDETKAAFSLAKRLFEEDDE